MLLMLPGTQASGQLTCLLTSGVVMDRVLVHSVSNKSTTRCSCAQTPETESILSFGRHSFEQNCRGTPHPASPRSLAQKIGQVRNPLATMPFVKRISRISEAIALLESCARLMQRQILCVNEILLPRTATAV